jgi:deoxycytidine triphosphate deaminase
MELSAATIKRYQKCEIPEWVPLIEKSDDSFDFIEGSAVDLSVDKVWRSVNAGRFTAPIIGKKVRRSSELRELDPMVFEPEFLRTWGLSDEEMSSLIGETGWYLGQGYYVAQSQEWVNCPNDIRGDVDIRRTYAVSGCLLGVTKIAPGYSGTITCSLHVTEPFGILIEKGAGFVTVTFSEMDSQDSDPHKQDVWDGANAGTDGLKPGR